MKLQLFRMIGSAYISTNERLSALAPQDGWPCPIVRTSRSRSFDSHRGRGNVAELALGSELRPQRISVDTSSR